MEVTTVEGKKDVVRLRLTIAGNQTPDDIERLIKVYEADGVLDEKSETAEKEIRHAVKTQADAALKTAKEDKTKREATLKSYRKDVKSNLEQMGLQAHVVTKAVKLATEMNEKGQFKLDQVYFKQRSNPEKAARLALFVLDEDLYNKHLTNGAVQEEKKNTAKKYRFRQTKSSGTTKSQGKKDVGVKDDETFNIADFED